MRTVRETERKYEAAELPDPAGLFGFGPGDSQGQQNLEAVYFDTEDLRLMRAGITLRRREGGSDAGWHLKLPAGTDSRDEIRLPLTGERSQPPPELVALTRVFTRGAEPAPVAQLDTRRTQWQIVGADGEPVAELVDDEVTAHTMGEQTEAVSWRELEVELLGGGRGKDLDRIERTLVKAGARRSASSSKLGRLLADRLPATPAAARVGARSSAAEVVLAYLAEQAGRLRRHDSLVRRAAPDAVHQMRVAARRMRSALQAYRRVIDREATRELTEELRWLAGELAAARDTEVLAQRLGTLLDGLPDELVLGPVRASVTRTFERRQVEARERALAALDSDRYLALHEAVDALLAEPPLTAAAARPAQRELPKSVARALRRLESRMREADAHPAASAQRDLALHETRKAAKRLRYATDAAEPALGKPATRLAKRLKGVQKLLGEHQDTAVARPVLRELAAATHLEGGNGFTFGLMYAAEAARAAEAEAALPGAWARLQKAAGKLG